MSVRAVSKSVPSFPPFSPAEERWLKQHGSPERVQEVLDSMPYRCEDAQLPAVSALRDWRSHCFDGALLAASALRRSGIRPYILDLCAVRDDDHLICAFRSHGCWGAVAKSNFAALTFREPIYRSPRELAASYFEVYFNLSGEKTLRRYSKPVPLPNIRRLDWESSSEAPKRFLAILADAPHYSLISSAQARSLSRVRERLFTSLLQSVDLRGAHGGANFTGPRKLKPVRPPGRVGRST